jgi:predicted nucleic acid-binding protein
MDGDEAMEMALLEALAKNPEGITFSALFIALLIYVIKTNGVRETKYQDREDKYQAIIKELSEALNNFKDLKEKVESVIKKG